MRSVQRAKRVKNIALIFPIEISQLLKMISDFINLFFVGNENSAWSLKAHSDPAYPNFLAETLSKT